MISSSTTDTESVDTADRIGRYRLSHLPPGLHQVEVRMNGSTMFRQDVELRASFVTRFDIMLTSSPRRDERVYLAESEGLGEVELEGEFLREVDVGQGYVGPPRTNDGSRTWHPARVGIEGDAVGKSTGDGAARARAGLRLSRSKVNVDSNND